MDTAMTQLETYLRDAEPIMACEPVLTSGGGHDLKFQVMSGGVTVLGKHSSTSAPSAGLMVRYEVAAWEVTKILGWEEMMGTTVLREMNHPSTGAWGEASLQVFFPAVEYCGPTSLISTEQTWKAGIIDTILLNSDRNLSNWLTTTGDRSHPNLILIDHGLTLSLSTNLNSTFVNDHRDEQVPENLVADIVRFAQVAMQSVSLCHLVGRRVVLEMIDRADRIVTTRRLE